MIRASQRVAFWTAGGITSATAVHHQLYLLFTPGLCNADPWETLHAALLGGVDLIQWRVKEPDPSGLARCMAMAAEHGVGVVINDDVEAAAQSKALGAHVGQDDMDQGKARKLLGDARLLGVSTHDEEQIHAALHAGADYIGFGPCYPTTTKGIAAGLSRAAVRGATRLASSQAIPLFAIGGITASNLPDLMEIGVHRVAVSSTILAARDPEHAAGELRDLLDRRG